MPHSDQRDLTICTTYKHLLRNFASILAITDFDDTIDNKVVFPIDTSNITSSYQEFFSHSGETPLDTLQTISDTKKGLKHTIIIGLTIMAFIFMIFITPKIRRKFTHALLIPTIPRMATMTSEPLSLQEA